MFQFDGIVGAGDRHFVVPLDGECTQAGLVVHAAARVDLHQPLVRAHALQLTARMAMKEGAYAGVAFPLTRGSVRPVTLTRYKAFTFASRGGGDTVVRFVTPEGAWTATVPGTKDWATHHVPFLSLKPVAAKGKTASAWNGDAVYQVEIGATRKPGETLSIEIDDVGFD